ncbi:MAG TPA: hypothetical protein VH370_17595, partial [Humisphaera sp.]|nr:hypothetical protein [Humisphaera sp.]
PDSVWRDYCAISSAQRDWESILGRDHIDSLLLDEAYHDRLLEAVRQSPRWHQMARSGSAVLFVRYPADGGLAGASPVF